MMGQYYAQMVEQEGRPTRVFMCKTTMYQDSGFKLMEHAWRDNPFCMSMCNLLSDRPAVVRWIGDYSNSVMNDDEIRNIYNHAWKRKQYNVLEDNRLDLRNHYLLDWTSKEVLDCDDYFFNASVIMEVGIIQGNGRLEWEKRKRCLHPLPLLTCIGNGQGLGDYDGSDMNMVGRWYGHLVNVVSKDDLDGLDVDVFTPIYPVFVETGCERVADTKRVKGVKLS